MSFNFADIKNKYEELEKESSFLNGYFQDIVEYKHFDGTHCSYHCSSYKEISDGWFAIFSEHNGSAMLSKDDVKWIKKNNELIYEHGDVEEFEL